MGISNKFHFIERDWVIYFPCVGNEGRPILKYGVAYRDRENKMSQPGRRINLEDVLKLPPILEGYPHTVGYFQESRGKLSRWTPEYIEHKKIQNKQDLIKWFYVIGV